MSTELVWISSTDTTNTDLYKLSKNKTSDVYEYYDVNDDETIYNLIDLTFVNIPTVMNVLHKRYDANRIYTYTGDVLISVNPFKTLDIYNISTETNLEEPHVYSLAQKAYNNLENNNQSILVSGESGSGKTENTKYILNYLCNKYADNNGLAAKIINSNYIIELFGNAKTTRNVNSSRFGKFIKLYVNENKRIVGGNIESYLLEKSRISSVNRFERSYHIFYLVCNNRNKLSKYDFKEPEYYSLLKNSDLNTSLPNFENLDLLEEIFTQFDFTDTYRDEIFAQLKLILELLNCQTNKELKYSLRSMPTILGILRLDLDDLLINLTTKTFHINGETIVKTLDEGGLCINIRSFCEDTYETVFDNIIKQISISLGEVTNKYISILDIFGFEVFDHNGYEQLCINYTNEMLQSIFNEYVFKNQQIEYNREKLNWTHVNYIQNDDIIDLFSGKLSLFSIINEQSILGSGNDSNIFNSFEKNISSELFTVDDVDRINRIFSIRHFTGNVKYTVDSFILKNRLGATKVPKIKTKLQYFMSQLAELKAELVTNNCYFIRCIKPNNSSSAGFFDHTKIYNQLLYSGIIQGIKIVLAGYPIKKLITTMNHEFRFLSYYSNRQTIVTILSSPDINKHMDKYQIGTTKIFMKSDYYTALHIKNNKCRNNIAILIQKNIRRLICYKQYCKTIRDVVLIQSSIRRFSAINEAVHIRQYNMAIVINSYCRKCICRYHYCKYRAASIIISKNVRMSTALYKYNNHMRIKTTSACRIFWWLKRALINSRIRNRSIIYRLTAMLKHTQSTVEKLSNNLSDRTIQLNINKIKLYNKDTEIAKLKELISEMELSMNEHKGTYSTKYTDKSIKNNMIDLLSMNSQTNNNLSTTNITDIIDTTYTKHSDVAVNDLDDLDELDTLAGTTTLSDKTELYSVSLSSDSEAESDLQLSKRQRAYISNSNLEELGSKMEKLYIELQDKNNIVELVQQNYRQLLAAYQREKIKKSLWESVSSMFT